MGITGRAFGDTPATNYVAAEAESQTGAVIVADSQASGGKYTKSIESYKELATAKVPDGQDAYTVWCRYKGASIQLKSIDADGHRHELNWIWPKPDKFTWAKFARHTKAELGTSIAIMRGPAHGEESCLDLIVFAKDDTFNPNTAFPKLAEATPTDLPTVVPLPSDEKPIAATVTVNWSKVCGQVLSSLYGTNDPLITAPERSVDDPQHGQILDDLGIRFLRFHNGGLTLAWSDASTQTWDKAKIAKSYGASFIKGRTIMQNIPHWPSWMKTQDDKTLDPADYDRYAAFCADLVRIVNLDLHKNVQYWEPQNEWELAYWKAGKVDQLWVLYNKCAIAMKAVDPSIKIGGPALSWDDPDRMKEFLKACGPNIDFLTWHRYGSGKASVSTDDLMRSAANFGTRFEQYPSLVASVLGNRAIPLMLDEYGVNYTWNSGETRQWTNIGAVWSASVLRNIAYAGIQYATNWNFQDRIYGMVDSKDQLRPAAEVYRWGNHALTGALYPADSTQTMVEAMAVRQTGGKRSVLLINKAAGTATVSINKIFGATRLRSVKVQSLDASGTSDSLKATDSMVMAPHSLILLSTG